MSFYQPRKLSSVNKLLNRLLCLLCAQVALICCQVTTASAQFGQPNTLNLDAIYVPRSYHIRPEDTTRTNSSTVQQRIGLGYSFSLSARVDTATGKVRSWMGMINGNYTMLKNRDYPVQVLPDRLLYSELGVIHYHSLKRKWAMMNLFSVGLNSDLVHISTNDLFINAGFIFMKHFNPNLTLGFGAFAYNVLSTPMVMPGLLFNWQTTGRFRVLVNVPTEVSVAYGVSKAFELKAAFRPKNINYDAENRLNPAKSALMYWELPIGLEAKIKGKRLDFMMAGGIMPVRSYTYGGRGIRNMFRSNPPHQFSSNFYVSAGLSYRLKK
ncbi:DUF6268 family outer membrane beta-barrel protein [Pedobacter sp. SYP-B3415]|uniref:DUF6268 family outer membrane beta-barrel protein n=1 Tax=Pedobacter sp. SYP-B3415 TaxID=2496641 RepID=UPI00101BC731|nr:DUF6268 family outer membrane beta-barrel protein [Pedobacter sp. SYP-B3415]